jgi:hypothetical protein
MEVSTKVRKRDIQCANVILDFKNLKVEKASMSGINVPPDFNRIVEYYHQHYAATIERLFRENGYEIVKQEPQKQEVPNEESNNTN